MELVVCIVRIVGKDQHLARAAHLERGKANVVKRQRCVRRLQRQFDVMHSLGEAAALEGDHLALPSLELDGFLIHPLRPLLVDLAAVDPAANDRTVVAASGGSHGDINHDGLIGRDALPAELHVHDGEIARLIDADIHEDGIDFRLDAVAQILEVFEPVRFPRRLGSIGEDVQEPRQRLLGLAGFPFDCLQHSVCLLDLPGHRPVARPDR